MRFHVVVIRPPGHIHASAFTEMAELIAAGLSALGHAVTVGENSWESTAVHIVFGAHHLLNPRGGWREPIPAHSILYNLEPLVSYAPWATQAFADGFAQYPVWDYARANEAYRRQHQWPGVWYTLPIGYVPQWTRRRLPTASNVDVLFYGALSPRRQQVLQALRDSGLRVQVLFGVYGPERDAWIVRSRLVLNWHQAPGYPFEGVRVGYLLANQAAVVSEALEDADDNAQRWHAGIVWTSTDQVVATCQRWVHDPLQRRDLAHRGWQRIQTLHESDVLAAVLDQMATNHQL
jgi:hypothetical protein